MGVSIIIIVNWWRDLSAHFFKIFTFRYFGHAIQVLRGKYDDPNDPGQISHFQALTTALSATVGMGNISGVAVAIAMGGPGAIFWMWISAFVGMSTSSSLPLLRLCLEVKIVTEYCKEVLCILSQKVLEINGNHWLFF